MTIPTGTPRTLWAESVFPRPDVARGIATPAEFLTGSTEAGAGER
jgi:hypothetical protein